MQKLEFYERQLPALATGRLEFTNATDQKQHLRVLRTLPDIDNAYQREKRLGENLSNSERHIAVSKLAVSAHVLQIENVIFNECQHPHRSLATTMDIDSGCRRQSQIEEVLILCREE